EKQISLSPQRFTAALALAFSPNSRFLATVGNDGNVRLFGLASGKELRTFDTGRVFAQSLVFSPDGKQLAAAGPSAVLHVWDVATGKPLFDEPGHRNTVTGL